jgi:hypothetical protein
MKNGNKTIVIKIGLVLLTVLFIAGCAGPKMETRPTKPFLSESDPKEFPEAIELIYDAIPGEVIKHDIYSETTIRSKETKATFYMSGQITSEVKNVSPVNDVTLKMSGEMLAGVIGRRIKKVKMVCTWTMSKKGKVLSTDCTDIKPLNLSQYFPDGPISIGSQWSNVGEFYGKDFGKIQLTLHNRLSKFALINNRLCARVDYEGKNESRSESGSDTITLVNFKGVNYYDVLLKESAYSQLSFLVEGFESRKGEEFSATMEFISKLNYSDCIFKRSIKNYLTSPNKPKQVFPSIGANIVTVTGTSANIRSAAGNEFVILTTVKQGDKLILLGEQGEWFNIRLENGQEGWIDRRFVK